MYATPQPTGFRPGTVVLSMLDRRVWIEDWTELSVKYAYQIMVNRGNGMWSLCDSRAGNIESALKKAAAAVRKLQKEGK